MPFGLEIIVERAEDFLELRIRARNERFGGEVEIPYETAHALQRMATALRGFPRGPADMRTCQLGGVHFRFASSDAQGHVAVEVRMEAGPQHVTLVLESELSAIDDFLRQLDGVARNSGNGERDSATLYCH